MSTLPLALGRSRLNTLSVNGLAFRGVVEAFNRISRLLPLSLGSVTFLGASGQLFSRFDARLFAGLMPLRVLGRRYNLKVLYSVVVLYAVNVVNLLRFQKKAAKVFRHYETVLVDVAGAFGHWMAGLLKKNIAAFIDRATATPVWIVWASKTAKPTSTHFGNRFRAALLSGPVSRHLTPSYSNWNTRYESADCCIQGGIA
jgi:hypothetical protein